jgi:hypothetical protein
MKEKEVYLAHNFEGWKFKQHGTGSFEGLLSFHFIEAGLLDGRVPPKVAWNPEVVQSMTWQVTGIM